VQHGRMRNRRTCHLEADPRQSTQRFVQIQDLFRYCRRIPNQERSRLSTQCIVLPTRHRRPAAFFADLGEHPLVSGVVVVGCLLRRLTWKAQRVDSDLQLLSRMARPPSCFAIQVDQRTEPVRLAANDCDHQGEAQHTGANE
jgi:hypothetical protein